MTVEPLENEKLDSKGLSLNTNDVIHLIQNIIKWYGPTAIIGLSMIETGTFNWKVFLIGPVVSATIKVLEYYVRNNGS